MGVNAVMAKIATATRMMRKRFDYRARAMGMTLAQWRTIMAVDSDEGLTQRRIAAMLEVGEVTAGRLIDRLVAQGWVTRKPDPADRRAYRIYVAPAVESRREQLAALTREEEEITFAGFTAAEEALLSDMLDRILANLATPCAPAGAAEPSSIAREAESIR